MPSSPTVMTLRSIFCFAALWIVSSDTASAQTISSSAEQPSAAGQPSVRRDAAKLTLAGADLAIAAARKQAEAMGVQSNIAVVDDGGHLLAFARMDGARPSSGYTAITKASSAAMHRQPTGPVGGDNVAGAKLSLALENAAAASGGKFTTLLGGIPIVCDEQVIGAVGVGGATGEQDAEVAAAGVAAVTATFNDANEQGSAAVTPKANLLVGKWLIEDIEGHGVIDNAQSTLEIAADGSVSGDTAVNRFFGKATLQGDSVQFGPMGSTRRAGLPALMDQESKYLAALSKVTRYQVDDKGLLHLFDAGGQELLRGSSTK